VYETLSWLLAGAAVLFVGISKAGFGGGLGILTTPLCSVAFGGREAIGILLPLLSAGDLFSLYPYWRKWEWRNLLYLLPGVVLGVVLGVQLIGRFSPRQLNVAIGVLAVAFVVFQFVKEVIFRAEGTFTPNPLVGFPFGLGAGLTSSFAHGAGPLVAMFLIPQRLPKEIYVGTTVLVFTWINWIKLPFFVVDRSMIDAPCFIEHSIITVHTLKRSALFLPLVPVGVWLGVWLNRRVSEPVFSRLVYVLTFLTGVQLIFGFDVARWLK
jgi:hypothetical protein